MFCCNAYQEHHHHHSMTSDCGPEYSLEGWKLSESRNMYSIEGTSTERLGLKGPPVLRNAIVISRSPFLLSPNVALFCEIS